MRISEWVASLLVVLGVSLMIFGSPGGPLWHIWLWCGGIALLTFGVRLTIDCGKQGDR